MLPCIVVAGLIWACGPMARAADAELQNAAKLLKRGRAQKACKALTARVAEHPDDLEAKFWLGRSYVALREYDKAIAQFRLVIRGKPDSRESWLWLGKALRTQGDEEGAKKAEAKAAALAPPPAPAEEKRVEKPEAPPPPVSLEEAVRPPGDLPELPDVGFTASKVKLNAADLQLHDDNLYDYTFTGAPTDWYVRGGQWEQMFRWTCTPTWTWFGGHSPSIAALWNKREFEGDIAIEVWAGMRMGYNPRVANFSSYINPNDINITICGDGANLSSGYSFIFGGWLNRYTRIMKGTKVLAETHDDAFLLPRFEDGWPGNFHRRWYNLKAVKTGTTLSFYFDNKLALQCEDPEPLQSGRVALWTYGNAIVTARARIAYEDERLERTPIVLPAIAPPEPLTGPQIVFTSDTHPSVQNDFENGIGQWQQRDGNDGAALSIVDASHGRSGKCLRLTNVNSGGTFGATAVSRELDATKYAHLAFAYRCDPGVSVNLFTVVNGQLYETKFTGTGTPAIDAKPLGAIEDVKADGKWHRAWFDLRGNLRRRYAEPEPLTLSEVYFANLSYNDYQQAGFGANPAGATWDIDDFFLGSPGASNASVAWKPAGEGVEVAGYAVVVNDKADTVPKGKLSQETTIEASGLKDGEHFVHVRPQTPDGTWGPTARYRLVADTLAPRLDKDGEGGCELTADGRLVIHLTDGHGVGVDPSSLSLAVAGRDIPVSSPAVRFDPVTETLTLDLAAAGIQQGEDDSLQAQLAQVSDRLGNVMSGSCKWALRSSARAKAAPPAPTVTCSTPYLVNTGFEGGPTKWEAWKSSPTTVARDDSTAASGRYSLRLSNQVDRAAFGVTPLTEPFNAGRYRLVSFDYKANDRIRADVIVQYQGRTRAIGFLDTATPLQRIGKIKDVAADDEWHHAEFDLYDLLRQDDPTASDYMVTTLAIGDYQSGSSRDSSNPRGATYHIDNFRIIPVVSAREGAAFKWRLFDLTGIAGSSWALDGSPDTEPDESVDGAETAHTFPPMSGPAYLHVRAQNGRGEWGPTTHYRTLLDGSSPTAGQPTPQDGASAAPAAIALPLSDEGIAGIDPATVRMTVAGKTYDLTNPGLVYNANSKTLTWRCERTAPAATVFANGQKVGVSVTAADLAGNPLTNPPTWSWVMDYSKDRRPPAIASLTSPTHAVQFCDTFEQGTDKWAAFGGAAAAQDTGSAASGAACLTMTVKNPGGSFGIRTPQSFSAARTPLLAFDYKISRGTTLDLIVLVGKSGYAVKFTDTDGGQKGAIANVVADGTWRHAQFNIGALLKPLMPNNKTLPVSGLMFTDRGARKTPAGATFSIDNVIVTASAARAAKLSWSCTDPTGIVGYSYVLDQQPTTMPDETPEGQGTSYAAAKIPTGVSFFHVRAKDGAGHWGPPAHYPLLGS